MGERASTLDKHPTIVIFVTGGIVDSIEANNVPENLRVIVLDEDEHSEDEEFAAWEMHVNGTGELFDEALELLDKKGEEEE